jgi:hypothetical protein
MRVSFLTRLRVLALARLSSKVSRRSVNEVARGGSALLEGVLQLATTRLGRSARPGACAARYQQPRGLHARLKRWVQAAWVRLGRSRGGTTAGAAAKAGAQRIGRPELAPYHRRARDWHIGKQTRGAITTFREAARLLDALVGVRVGLTKSARLPSPCVSPGEGRLVRSGEPAQAVVRLRRSPSYWVKEMKSRRFA